MDLLGAFTVGSEVEDEAPSSLPGMSVGEMCDEICSFPSVTGVISLTFFSLEVDVVFLWELRRVGYLIFGAADAPTLEGGEIVVSGIGVVALVGRRACTVALSDEERRKTVKASSLSTTSSLYFQGVMPLTCGEV